MDLATLTARLGSLGFDIVQPFPAHVVARETDFARLHDPARPVGVLVGNTRALWPHVMAVRAEAPEMFERDPFDRYTEASIGTLGWPALYAHAQDRDGRFFPFQRLAVAVGLAALSPSQLLIHSTYGPWFALRAVILLAGTPPPLAPRVALPCTCGDGESRGDGSVGLRDERRGCRALFDHAMAHPEDWRAWLAVREACPIGREFRYDDDQLAYHYTKDARYLPAIG